VDSYASKPGIARIREKEVETHVNGDLGEILMNEVSGEDFERWAKEILQGGVTREELIERLVDLSRPEMGSQLKAFHDEHGYYPDWSPQPGGPRLKMY